MRCLNDEYTWHHMTCRLEVDNSVLDTWHHATRGIQFCVIDLATTRQRGGFSCDIVVQKDNIKKVWNYRHSKRKYNFKYINY